MNIECSQEQRNVINYLENHNVIVDSVAGSGKTTCNIFIAQQYNDKNILLLTYNSKLKIETREKIIKNNISNMEVHSFHSFCVKYYDRTCITDGKIEKVINVNNNPLKPFSYDIIIVDEAQDMTERYFKLVCKIINDNQIHQNVVKLCVTGDQNQKIYDFKNADERFITLANRIYSNGKIEWKMSGLSRSFRITHNMAEFVNNCLLGSNRITSKKQSNYKPSYVICDCFTNEPFKILKTFLDAGYEADDIFILAPSVSSNKGESMITKLENRIKKKLENIKVYVSNSDDEKLDQDVIKNKIVFTTFHQSKGMERKVVIIFNFDNSFFKWYFRTKNPNVCPNELYVGATRASEHIVFLHHYREDYLPFLNTNKLKSFANVSICSGLKVYDSNNTNEVNRRIDGKIETITGLTKHLSSDTIIQCKNLLNVTVIKSPEEFIKIDTKVENNDQFESVSDITGTAIPLYYELAKKRDMGIRLKLKPLKLEFLKEYQGLPYAEKVINNRFKITCIEDLLVLSTLWLAYKSGFDYKLYQIPKYDWLDRKNLNKCVERINSLNISIHASFEKVITHVESSSAMHKILEGYLDCVDGNNIYEFKCVDKLLDEHFIQLSLYMYIYSIKHPNCNYFLYNILDGELYQVKCDKDNLRMILNIISDEKFGEKVRITNDEFVQQMQSHYHNYNKIELNNYVKSYHVVPNGSNYIQKTVFQSAEESNCTYAKLTLNKSSNIIKVEMYENDIIIKSKGKLTGKWNDLEINFVKTENNVETTILGKTHDAFINDMERELKELERLEKSKKN